MLEWTKNLILTVTVRILKGFLVDMPEKGRDSDLLILKCCKAEKHSDFQVRKRSAECLGVSEAELFFRGTADTSHENLYIL